MKKYMFASDLHGSAYYCRRLIEAYRKSGADRLILLGDLLYHGPRNDLPRDYAPREVAAMLNEYKTSICAVRGNCDAEVDQMVLEFPALADYALLALNGLAYPSFKGGKAWGTLYFKSRLRLDSEGGKSGDLRAP